MTSIQLHEVFSIKADQVPGSFILDIDWADAIGERHRDLCGYTPGDPYGLGPVIGQWIEDNTDFPIESYVPPDPLTDEETRAQMPELTACQLRLGLLAVGISPSQVSATIAAMPAGRDKAQIEWEYATTFNRVHPLITLLGSAFGLADAEVDSMWLTATGL